MRAMALDVGDVRIGIALSDPLLVTAQGLETLERIGMKKDTNHIIELMKEHQVNILVIGLPLGLAGNDTEQTEKVRTFKEKLENKIRSSGMKDIEIFFQDERMTTNLAERVLLQADVSRKGRKAVVDKMAATVILQSYLDGKSGKCQ